MVVAASPRVFLPVGDALLVGSGTTDGLSLEVTAGDRRFVLALRLAPPVALRATGRSDVRWDLTAGPSPPGSGESEGWEDCFKYALRWALDAGGPEARLDAEVAREEIDRMKTFAHGLLNRSASAVAMRFTATVRFRVYARVAFEPSGRAAQLIEACPGAALFAIALEEQGGSFEAVAQELWEDVLAGQRLDRLLARAVAGWFEAVQHRVPVPEWARLVGDSPEKRARLLQEQRWLVRHASAMVGTREILLPPPLAFALEDVPREPAANAAWFRVMKLTPLTVPSRHLPSQLALARWASRQAAALHDGFWGAAGPGDPQLLPDADGECSTALARELGDLLDYLRTTGRRPPGTLPLSALLEESARWHREVADARGWMRNDGETQEAETYDPSQPLPVAPFNPFRFREIAVDPIATVGALVTEGREMHNCVATHLPDLLDGDVWIASARVAGVRLTVEVAREPAGGLRIVEARGICNASTTPRQDSALAFWLAAVESGRDPVDDGEVGAAS